MRNANSSAAVGSNTVPVLQLLCFLSGSLLTLIYFPFEIFSLHEKFLSFSFCAVLCMSVFFSASYFGIFVFPILSFLSGCLSAAVMETLISGSSNITSGMFLLLLITVPVQFCLTDCAMYFSARIRSALKSDLGISRETYKQLYLLIISATAAVAIAAAVIIK